MKIVGVSSDFHDASTAVLDGGELVCSAAEERFSLLKHDSNFPSLSLAKCLRSAQLNAESIDAVAYHEEPAVKFSRVVSAKMSDFPSGFRSFARTMRDFVAGQMWMKLDLLQALRVPIGKIHCVPHHASHATYAFVTSGFEEAAVLVADAAGEWSSTTMFKAKRLRTPQGDRLSLEPLGVVSYPHSLGMVYSAFTGFLGFAVNDAECSLMALAAFGRPKYAGQVREIIRVQSDGTYDIDLSYFDFSGADRLPISARFLSTFGPPRSRSQRLPFSSRASENQNAKIDSEFQRFADIASSIQLVLEEAMLSLCAKLKRETGLDSLCLAGGIALNSVANGRIAAESGFRHVHIPPDPGDGGGALGAAYFVQAQRSLLPSQMQFSAYGGFAYSEDSTLEMIEGMSAGGLTDHRTIPTSLAPVSKLSIDRVGSGDDGELAARVAGDLRAGKIVGWFQGRFENGPRALGNRSILIDPENEKAAQRLSRHVKLRAAYRPYACSILREDAQFAFASSSNDSRWMSSTRLVREDWHDRLRTALHVDGTTRPQVLGPNDNPRYQKLLEAWRSERGHSGLVNTSFNPSGFPLVSTPTDALIMFLRTDMETLVLNNSIIRKVF